MMTELEKNKEYVETNYERLLSTYPNKYVVVFNREVVNAFDTYDVAANYGVENYGIEEKFLVELITQKEPINFTPYIGFNTPPFTAKLTNL